MANPSSILQLVSGISFSDVSLAILAVAGVLVPVFVLYKGVKQILVLVGSGSTKSRPVQSRESYAWENFVSGKYIPRSDFEAILTRHPELSKEQTRSYAKKMAKQGMWVERSTDFNETRV